MSATGQRMALEGDRLTLRETARRLRVHENTVSAMLDDGRLQLGPPRGRFRTVSAESVERFLLGQGTPVVQWSPAAVAAAAAAHRDWWTAYHAGGKQVPAPHSHAMQAALEAAAAVDQR